MHGLGKLQSCPFAGIYRVALVCLLALFGSSLFAVELPPASADGAIRIQGPGVSPKLFFACCDQGIADLESWVSNPKVISELQGLHAGLAVEISDFTDTRAQAVRKLDEAGIPLTAVDVEYTCTESAGTQAVTILFPPRMSSRAAPRPPGLAKPARN